MAAITRRPLPALIALVALLALTAIVWVRVLNRDSAADPQSSGTACSTPKPPTTGTALPNAAAVDVLILNSTKRNGIAASARRTLISYGFTSSMEPGNDTAKVKVKGVAEIRYGVSGRAGATLLRYYFPGATLAPSASITTALVTIALGAQYKAVATKSAVQTALAKAKIAVSTAPPPPPTPSPTPSGTGSPSPGATSRTPC